jgi:hypothetical protein
VRVLDPKCWAPGKDVTDWLDAGHTREELDALLAGAARYDGPEPEAVIEPVDLWGQFDPPPLPKGLLPERQWIVEEDQIASLGDRHRRNLQPRRRQRTGQGLEMT